MLAKGVAFFHKEIHEGGAGVVQVGPRGKIFESLLERCEADFGLLVILVFKVFIVCFYHVEYHGLLYVVAVAIYIHVVKRKLLLKLLICVQLVVVLHKLNVIAGCIVILEPLLNVPGDNEILESFILL